MTRAVVLLVLAAALLAPATALAAPPPNDSWANRTPLALPSQSSVDDIRDATSEASDPAVACAKASKGQHSIWYSFTTGPGTRYVNLSTAGSDFGGALLSVYEGAPGSFRLVAGGCTWDGADRAGLHGLRLEPNTAYSIELAVEDGPLPDGHASLSLSEAPIYRVTTPLDDSGACTAGACTLRAAISAANAAPGAVIVPAGQYALSAGAGEDDNVHGDLDVRAGIGIYGAGVGATFINAAHNDRVVHIQSGRAAVALSGLTLRNGNVSGYGGGVLVESTGSWVDLDEVSIEGSSATTDGGGLASYGSGRLLRSTVTANTADGGGGLALQTAGARFEVRDSTIAGNVATIGGGLVTVDDLAIVDSTVSDNSGAGVITGGNTTLRSVTVAGNAPSDRVTERAGALVVIQGTLDVRNSVLADSPGGADCANFQGSFSAAYTLAEQPGSCDFSGAGNTTGTDPGLQPLSDNGGPTRTQLPGGPLIDQGDPAGCDDADGLALALDQRGLPRTVNRCDLGAVEMPAAAAPPPVTPATAPPVVPAAAAPKARRPVVVSKLAASRHGRQLRFKLSAPARVTIRITRKHWGKTYRLKGKTGTNTLKLKLARHRYRVRVTAAQGTTVTRKLMLGR